MIEIKREDDGNKGRFALYEDGTFAGDMTFTWAGPEKFIIDHTGVDEAFGGKGYAKKLLMEAVGYARENNLKIIPLCPYAKAQFDRIKEIGDVLF